VPVYCFVEFAVKARLWHSAWHSYQWFLWNASFFQQKYSVHSIVRPGYLRFLTWYVIIQTIFAWRTQANTSSCSHCYVTLSEIVANIDIIYFVTNIVECTAYITAIVQVQMLYCWFVARKIVLMLELLASGFSCGLRKWTTNHHKTTFEPDLSFRHI